MSNHRAQVPKDALFPACVMAVSGCIAFVIYYYFKWPDGYWAVVSIAAVTQRSAYATFEKTVLRLLGTFLGAFVAYYSVVFLPISYLVTTFLLGLFVCLLLSLSVNKYRYLMIVTGISYTLVMSSGLRGEVESMAIVRTYEVVFGCVLCILVSYGCHFLLSLPKIKAPSLVFQLKFNKTAWFQAMILTIACGITFLTWQWLDYPLGFWGTISCLFVIEENIGRSLQNGFNRVLAHIWALGFTAMIAFYIPSTTPWVLVPLTVGLFLSGYTFGVQNESIRGIGNTLGIAIVCMLLTTSPGMTQEDIVLWRFINIIYGVSVGFTTMYFANHWISSRAAKEHKKG